MGEKGLIICTQPRRVAAITVAGRLQQELGPKGKDLVGYRIRFKSRAPKGSRIHFVTDGLLLAEMGYNPYLRGIEAVIVDEAHERSLNIDFLIGLLKDRLRKRPDLKLIITSATLDIDTFKDAFKDAPILEIEGRQHPVEIEYWDPCLEMEEKNGELEISQKVLWAVKRLSAMGVYENTLVFLPTERSILDTRRVLEGELKDEFVVLPLFSRLAQRYQKRVFQSYPRPKIILATNVAETSLTIPGIRTVIDLGLARISRFNVRTRTRALPITHISKSSAKQRAGRAGRTGPGLAIRLYSEEEYNSWDEHTTPEIKRSNLDWVLLKMLAMGIREPSKFPFIDPPNKKAIRDGLETLKELGAIDDSGGITSLGRTMARLPLEPRISRMVIEGERLGVVREVLIIASALSLQDIWEANVSQRISQGPQGEFKIMDPDSDFITLLRVWGLYRKLLKTHTKKERQEVFQRIGLNHQRLEEWQDIYAELKAILVESGIDFKKGASTNRYEAIHKAILTGFLSNVAQKRLDGTYSGVKGRELHIFPGSSLAKKRPQWIVCAEVVRTTKTFARTCARIEPEWIEEVGQYFLKAHIENPHWEKGRGAVVAIQKLYLWGLLVNPDKRILFHKIDPGLSREIFIREGLSQCELGQGFSFNQHNKRILEEIEELEAKLRTRQVVDDPERIVEFFHKGLSIIEEKCPSLAPINNERALKRALRQLGDDSPLRLSRDFLLKKTQASDAREFPGHLILGGHKIRLYYRYSPGRDEDGVTAVIPAKVVHNLSSTPFEWLVPGLLPQKLEYLLKALPKSIRRHLTPVRHSVERITKKALLTRDIPLRSWLSSVIKEEFGLEVPLYLWPKELELPNELRFRFEIVGKSRRVIARGRDLEKIKRELVAKGELSLNGPTSTSGAMHLPNWPTRKVHTLEDLKGILSQVGPKGKKIEGLRGWLALIYKEKDGFLLVPLMDHRQAVATSIASLKEFLFNTLKKEFVHIEKRLIRHGLSKMTILYFGGEEAFKKQVLSLVKKDLLWDEGLEPTYETIVDRVAYLRANLYKEASRALPALFSALSKWEHVRGEIASLFEKRKRLPKRYEESLYKQLDECIPVDFHKRLHLLKMDQVERRLDALLIRARRLYVDPGKDERKYQKIAPYKDFLTRLEGLDPAVFTVELRGLVEEFKAAVDEFEIQTFAPEIRPRFKVSSKRLDELREEIQFMLPERI